MMDKVLKGVITAGSALAAYEVLARWSEESRRHKGTDAWRNYHNPTILEHADSIRETYSIVSTGVPIHIDVYPQPYSDAPVLVLNHGGATHTRMFTEQIMVFYERGYTIVSFDRRGQGLSGGRRGDSTWSMDVQNGVDVARWAKTRFDAPQFMIGFSLGGPLTYYAAAAGAPVDAICCFNLYDFTEPNRPGANLFGNAGKFLAKAWPVLKYFGWMSVPWRQLNPKMWEGGIGDLQPHIQAVVHRDPLPLKVVTMALAHSMVTTPPKVPFEHNRIPVLVINPTKDKMTDPALTKQNYDRLGGTKHYVEIPYGHFGFSEMGFYNDTADAADTWFKRYMPAMATKTVQL
jgi:alpha-beta hydrolase superfamily lysophospholipase